MYLNDLIKQVKAGRIDPITLDELLEAQESAYVMADNAVDTAVTHFLSNTIDVYACDEVGNSPWWDASLVSVDKPLFKIQYCEDKGDPSVGIPMTSYWYVSPDVSETLLEYYDIRAKIEMAIKED